MLKIFTFRKIAISTLLLLLAIILYNYPEEINDSYIVEDKVENIDIFLIDDNNFVSMTKIKTTNLTTDNKIKEIINSLIIGNNKNLPDGFEAIIPEGTKLIDYSLKDGLIKVNFTKELLNVNIKNEEKMIESLIYSLTSLKNIDKVMIFVEGEILLELPNSHKKLNIYLDRNYGINKIVDIDTLTDTKMVTIYFLSKTKNYIPISYVTSSKDDKIEIIINSLKSNKFNNSDLLSHLDYQVELMNYENNEGEFFLNFNEILLNSFSDGALKEEVKYAISYSIIDTFDVNNVIFQVNSQKIDEFRLEK